jgi:cell division protein FtsZ
LESQIDGARSAIINITGGDKVSLFDAQNAVAVIQDAAGGDVDCIFGIAINESLGDSIIVTVIATGFEEKKSKKSDVEPIQALSGSSNDDQSLFTQPKVQTPGNAGVVTSVEDEDNGDDSIPNFFFNR